MLGGLGSIEGARAREGEAAGEAEGDDVAAKGDEDNGEVSSDASVTRFLREI